MTSNRELDSVWDVLHEIKDDFKQFDAKWEIHIQNVSEDKANIKQLCRQMENIERLLTQGNGQKSVLVQLEGLHRDVNILKEDAQVEVTKARWVVLAKIVGLVAITLPGIFALLGMGG